MNMGYRGLVVAGLWLLIGLPSGTAAEQATSGQTRDDVPLPALNEARRAGNELTDRVRGLLLGELERGGYVGAANVCAQIAPGIATDYSRQVGFTVRRISLKYRNPADRPDDYEAKILRQFAAQLESGRLAPESAEVVRNDGRSHLRYLKPIVIGKMCLQCHGEPTQIAPEIRELLKRQYPEDLAIGYREGDLRGAVSVRIDLPWVGRRTESPRRQ